LPLSINAPETPPTTAPRPAPWAPWGVEQPLEKSSKPVITSATPISQFLFFMVFTSLNLFLTLLLH
jgi:hypothetical protein